MFHAHYVRGTVSDAGDSAVNKIDKRNPHAHGPYIIFRAGRRWRDNIKNVDSVSDGERAAEKNETGKPVYSQNKPPEKVTFE